MSIKVEQVSKRYGEQWAVKDLSFTVSTGEILGFIGPNGAGKSTTMKIITGYLPATSGRVEVNGMELSTHQMEIKRSIGYLPEHNPLYPEMYVREYLQYTAGLYGIKGKKAASRIDEVIELVGLTRESHKRIAALSKGYKQRVGISQALIHDPDVLILDEPTSGLDPNQIVEVRNLISTVGKEKTLMLSTHIMQEVEAICDRVIIIDQGTLKADRSARDIDHASDAVQTIEIELQEEVDAALWNAFEGISELRQVDPHRLLIATTSSQDIRSDLFRFAVQNGFTILSMTRKEKRLEEVFRELTNR